MEHEGRDALELALRLRDGYARTTRLLRQGNCDRGSGCGSSAGSFRCCSRQHAARTPTKSDGELDGDCIYYEHALKSSKRL